MKISTGPVFYFPRLLQVSNFFKREMRNPVTRQESPNLNPQDVDAAAFQKSVNGTPREENIRQHNAPSQ